MRQKLQTCVLGIAVLLLGVAVVMVFASFTTALLILRDSSAPVGAMAPAPYQPVDPTADQISNASPIANGQSIFTSRSDSKVSGAVERTPAPSSSTRTRALETVDPRELLRQAEMRK